jgi:hypothetical protein
MSSSALYFIGSKPLRPSHLWYQQFSFILKRRQRLGHKKPKFIVYKMATIGKAGRKDQGILERGHRCLKSSLTERTYQESTSNGSHRIYQDGASIEFHDDRSNDDRRNKILDMPGVMSPMGIVSSTKS